jgi:LytS/YehU family sensor histidine kinase
LRNRDALCLEISNLTGVLDGEPEQLFSRGVGLSNTRRRLEQLYGERQALDIFDGRPSGVGVRLSMPARALESDVNLLPAGVAP